MESAGERLVAEGVAVMFALAIKDYAENLPPAIEKSLYELAPLHIAALIDNSGVADDAQDFLRIMLEDSKK